MEVRYLHDKGIALQQKPVAVFVPVVHEPLRIIQKTLTGIAAMKGNKNIYLLDDGNRDELKILCEQLHITYIRRDNRRFNKSGNLTNALRYTHEDYIAVFDADFIPKEHFLERTLPLFVDEKIGLVQTPQVYYNENTFFSKGFKNFQNLFYNYIMPAKSMQHSGICVGTNVVYRKSAIEAIGGFPRLDHSEDVNTSLQMHEIGYQSFYLNEALAIGLSPDNVVAFFNQQFRWSKGGLTMLFRNNTLFNKNLNWDQRIHFFFSNLFYLSGIAIFIYLLTPLLAIIFNSSAINPDFFAEWLKVYALFFIANVFFYSFMVRKNLLNSIALGLFCYVPYTRAIGAALFNKRFNWKTTNTKSSDVVTKLVAPFFPYILTTGTILYLFANEIIILQTSFLLYAFWMGVNTLLVIYLIVNSYISVLQKKQFRMKKRVVQPMVWQPLQNYETTI